MARQKSYDEGEVLEKAMYTFWENGYKNTSVRTLENSMGINQFSIYSSFKSKRALFAEVLRRYKLHIEKEFLSGLVSENSGLSDIKQFLESFALAIKSGRIPNGCLMVNTAAEIENKGELYLIIKSYFNTMRSIFRTALKNAQSKGEIAKHSDIDKYANYLLGIAQSITTVAKFQTNQQINEYIDFVMKSIR